MKYRVKEIKKNSGSIYYPQYKKFIVWKNYRKISETFGFWTDALFCTIKEAENHITDVISKDKYAESEKKSKKIINHKLLIK